MRSRIRVKIDAKMLYRSGTLLKAGLNLFADSCAKQSNRTRLYRQLTTSAVNKRKKNSYKVLKPLSDVTDIVFLQSLKRQNYTQF
jgi:hypothetical protein